MTKIKSHLKELYRTDPDENPRKGYLCLNMNEGVHGLPENFVKKTLTGIKKELLASYPEYSHLKKKIARHNNIKYENITLANGSNGAIKHIFDAYISEGDKVLMTDPTFAMYPVYCKMSRAKVVTVQYGKDLAFPYDAFSNALSKDIKMAVIVNPNNPTGSVLDKNRMISLLKKAKSTGTLVVIDEAYFYFYPETIIENVNDFDNLIVLRTFSKLCAMAALRLGYAAACEGITKGLNKVKPTYDVNALAVFFGEKLLDETGAIENLVIKAAEGKNYLISKLSACNIPYYAGKANFILIRCDGRVKEIIKSLKKRGVLVAGDFKQPFLKGYIRVTTGNKEVMKKFWKIFSDIWEKRSDE